MSDHEPSQQEVEDELTAYLDGELKPENVRRVEERLARDPGYQAQLQQLERAWGMLDRLPRASVDETFTATTLEMVALSAAKEADEVVRQEPNRLRRRRMTGLISLAAAILVGFAIGSQVWPDPNRALIEDLPVVENLDLYYQVSDIELLRLLDRQHVFDESEPDSLAASDSVEGTDSASGSGPRADSVASGLSLVGTQPTAAELARRRDSILQRDSEQQQDLLRKSERFAALPAEDQQRLRGLQAEIMADPNSEKLLHTLEHYHEWLKTISTSQRAKLAELPSQQQVKQVEEIQRQRRDEQRLEPLTRQDMREINRWMERLIELHRKQLVAGIPSRYREWYNKQTDPGAKQMALVFRLFGRSRDDQDADSKVTQEEIDRLTQKLSASAQAELAKEDSLEAKRRLVRGWVFATLRRSSAWQRERRGNPVVGDELLQFLQTDVPPAERERLLKLPREEMLHQLRRMYFERSVGSRRTIDGPRPGGDRRPPHRGSRGEDSKPRPRPTQEAPTEAAPTAAAESPGPAASSAPAVDSPTTDSPTPDSPTPADASPTPADAIPKN